MKCLELYKESCPYCIGNQKYSYSNCWASYYETYVEQSDKNIIKDYILDQFEFNRLYGDGLDTLYWLSKVINISYPQYNSLIDKINLLK